MSKAGFSSRLVGLLQKIFSKPKKVEWDDYLMALACLVSMKSPDPSTKHGCVIVDSKKRILGLGYNGFPRGAKEDDYPTTRPEKYDYIIHSEPNCIYNCTHRPEGGTVYVTGVPCSQCMLDMVQAGIVKIIYGQIGSNMVDPEESAKTFKIASNHGVEMIEYTGRPSELLVKTCWYLEEEKGWK